MIGFDLELLMERSVLEKLFTYHPPKEGQPEKYERIREKAKELAYLLLEVCPETEEHAIALTRLQDVVFWANASIARHG